MSFFLTAPANKPELYEASVNLFCALNIMRWFIEFYIKGHSAYRYVAVTSIRNAPLDAQCSY